MDLERKRREWIRWTSQNKNKKHDKLREQQKLIEKEKGGRKIKK